MASIIQPIILCGGSGTRLWPLSRAEFPKQFLSLFGKESLFQLAAQRLTNFADEKVAEPLIVSNEEHRFLILQQLKEISLEPKYILLEPVGRNTAPALALAAFSAQEGGGDPILVVSPADQMVLDNAAFSKAILQAVKLAQTGAVALLGILPDRPETGYGYIKRSDDGTVEKFVEKPNLETAFSYIKEGGYYWNSGIFVLKASVWQAALQKYRPDIADAVKSAWEIRQKDEKFTRPDSELFTQTPSESIDYAVIEKSVQDFDVRVVPLVAGWSDLGSWDSAWQSAEKDINGNSIIGDALIKDSNGIFVHATSRLVSVVGVSNVVVVETPDAVLVIDKARSQEVKQIVAELGKTKRSEHMQHRKVHRPWGWYDSIEEGEGFKVKRIMVRPHASLSLQKHSKRAEHWVVVSGTAEVVCGEKKIILHENQSTYIPLGEIHRLTNPSDKPLEIIEVQSGSYLGEDDIVRLGSVDKFI